MHILVWNAGSSSLKFGVFNLELEDCRVVKGEFQGFQPQGCTLRYRLGGETGAAQERPERFTNTEEAITHIPGILKEWGYMAFDAIAHRVTHGKDYFQSPVVIDAEVLRAIEACVPLAPLHNPAHLQCIRLSRAVWPDVPQVAVFDTAFHSTIPEYAYTYAIPKAWREKGVRRYGFHGTSHQYVAMQAARAVKRPVTDLRIISCHLGNGASVCAIQHGCSVDTSMGMTPLSGLVMGSRSGDIDPGLFTCIARDMPLDIAAIEQQLYFESGLRALAGSSDLREVEQHASEGNADAQLAIEIYAYRVRQYIGAYAASMGGVDVLAFTGGIGENSSSMRRRVCEKLGFLGLELDNKKNNQLRLKRFEVVPVHAAYSAVRVLVTQTCEQLMIARQAQSLLLPKHPSEPINWPLSVAVSARHVHLSRAAVDALFGTGYVLQKRRALLQRGSWAAEETVEVIGPKGSFKRVRVLGPERNRTQIEVSKTDSFTLGLEVPVRASGQLEGTPPVILRGPHGELQTDGLIVAARHIHMSPEDANRMGWKDGDYVDVRLENGERDVLFSHTLIRVQPHYVTEMHIDTDEANAAGLQFVTQAGIVVNDTRIQASIVKK